MLKSFFYSNWKQFHVFKIVKFESKVTVHYDLWAKCTQLDPFYKNLHQDHTWGGSGLCLWAVVQRSLVQISVWRCNLLLLSPFLYLHKHLPSFHLEEVGFQSSWIVHSMQGHNQGGLKSPCQKFQPPPLLNEMTLCKRVWRRAVKLSPGQFPPPSEKVDPSTALHLVMPKKCYNLTAHNWQNWKRVFLTCPCHNIYRDEAVV